MESKPQVPVLLRSDVLSVPAYRQGIAAPEGGFKLSSNEIALPPLPSVQERVQRAVAGFNRYGDSSQVELRSRLAAQFGVTPDGIHIAAGSVSILYQLAAAACGPGDEYIHAWPSFEAYPALGLAPSARAIAVPLRSDATHDLDAMAQAVTESTRAIFLCSPNNPTGPIIRRDEFDAFMRAIPSDILVVLDEAYREFITDSSAVFGEEVIRQYPQLVLLRTFSKAYGLAGLRIGYAVGDPLILRAAKSVSIPLSITQAAGEGALASLDAEDELFERIAEISLMRDQLAADLRAIGLRVPDAQGNFVWCELGDHAQPFADFFASAGIVIRAFPGFGVRIGVGEPESIPRVIELASRFMSEHPRAAEEG